MGDRTLPFACMCPSVASCAASDVCQVSDYGLARDVHADGVYHKANASRVPFKWMALEALTLGQHTTKSDVWSFGVVVWEIFTLGERP